MVLTVQMQALRKAHFTEPFGAGQAMLCMQWSRCNFFTAVVVALVVETHFSSPFLFSVNYPQLH